MYSHFTIINAIFITNIAIISLRPFNLLISFIKIPIADGGEDPIYDGRC